MPPSWDHVTDSGSNLAHQRNPCFPLQLLRPRQGDLWAAASITVLAIKIPKAARSPHPALQPSLPVVGLPHTLQDVLHDRLQHHLLVCVLHQDEPGKVLEDQLLEPGQLLPGGAGMGQREGWSGRPAERERPSGCTLPGPPVRPILALRDQEGAGAEGLQQAGAEWGGWGTLTDLQVGASFLSRNGMVICSSASRKKRFRTELLS